VSARRLFRNLVNALDFAQGRKTKLGAFIVLVGKVVSQFNPGMGELLVQFGEWFALYGLALVAARKLSPPKNGAAPPDPMPEQKLSKEEPFDKPYGART
jgi:hypothetical protein